MYLQTLFHTSNGDDFLPHQPLDHGSYAEILATAKINNLVKDDVPRQKPHIDTNVLNQDAVKDINEIVNEIRNTSAKTNGKLTNYAAICAQRNQECVITGQSVLDSLSWGSENNCYLDTINGTKVIPQEAGSVLSDMFINSNHCLSASALRIRFYLKENQTEENMAWQRKISQDISQYESNFTHIDVTVSDALDIELSRHVGHDCRFLLFSIVTMLLYATLQGAGGNWVSNHVTLAYAGVFAALLSIMAAFGFLSICGLRFVNMSGVMPFLVIGKIIEI